MRALDAAQMRAADARGCARTSDVALMREAGKRLAEAVDAMFRELELAPRRCVAFAGPGNNGGDAFAAFAELEREIECVVYAMPAPKASAARLDAEERARRSGVEVYPFPASAEEARAALAGAGVVLDALLGTGSRAEPSAAMAVAIEAMNAGRARVLAVDIPTGVDATTGAVASCAVRADRTVMLGAPKYGVLIEPARNYAGRLIVGRIGLDDEVGAVEGPRVETMTEGEFVRLVRERSRDAQKRTSGAPLVVAGSEQFPGAAILCARAAARAGAGYVTVAVEAAAAASLRAHLVEEVVVTYDARDPERAIETLLDLTGRCSSVAIGPGLGLGDGIGAIVRGFVERLELPFVADASALFHFAKHLELLRGKRCVLTPHEGEFARLSGEGTIAPGTRRERLRAFVARTGITTLLKGPATLIDDGTTLHVNTTGTAALATAGTGDVLSGMIGTLLAQGLAPVDAATAAAYWHGKAGVAAHRRRSIGVLAGDLPDVLHEPVTALRRRAEQPGRNRLLERLS